MAKHDENLANFLTSKVGISGQHPMPWFVASQYFLNADFGDRPFSSEIERQRHFQVWWYLYRSRQFPVCWPEDDLHPNMRAFLYAPFSWFGDETYFDDQVRFCNVHYYTWALNDFLQNQYRLETHAERSRFLGWYYSYGRALNGVLTRDERKSLERVYGRFEGAFSRSLDGYLLSYLECAGVPWGSLENSSACERSIARYVFGGPMDTVFVMDDEWKNLFSSAIKIKEYPDLKVSFFEYLVFQSLNKDLGAPFVRADIHQQMRLILQTYSRLPNEVRLGLERDLASGSSNQVLPSRDERLSPTILPPNSSGGVTLFGFPFAELGLGEDIRMTASAIRAQNLPVSVVSFETESGQHPLSDQTVAGLHRPDIQYDVAILNAPMQYAAVHFSKTGDERFFSDRYLIGYSPWEFDRWKPELDFCFEFYKEIWAPSRFIQNAFRDHCRKPLLHMPLAVGLPEFTSLSREELGLPKEKFLFCFAFDFNSKVSRKNPWATLNAFKRAFVGNSDVGLVIKVMYTNSSDPAWRDFKQAVDLDPRIHLIDRTMSRSEILALLHASDAFVSLHRSEGFGRALAESMLLGKPVIATGYSGNMDFCSDQTCFLVDFKLVEVQPGEYSYAEGFLWADADVDHAAEQMRFVYNRSAQVNVMTQAAQRNIAENFSPEFLGQKYAQRVKQILEETK
jgi:glycosyltransferase involved in cell wall biosynthesis